MKVFNKMEFNLKNILTAIFYVLAAIIIIDIIIDNFIYVQIVFNNIRHFLSLFYIDLIK